MHLDEKEVGGEERKEPLVLFSHLSLGRPTATYSNILLRVACTIKLYFSREAICFLNPNEELVPWGSSLIAKDCAFFLTNSGNQM